MYWADLESSSSLNFVRKAELTQYRYSSRLSLYSPLIINLSEQLKQTIDNLILHFTKSKIAFTTIETEIYFFQEKENNKEIITNFYF